ncbi:MAG: TadE family protein [Steroidobacteraceae bacterium]
MLNRPPLNSRFAGGAALVEFYVVALFALFPFTMAIMQTAVLLSAKNIVNHATFMAARAGSFEQASKAKMIIALARGLMPLHARSSEEIDAGNAVTISGEAFARSLADTLLFAKLQIVNPGPAAFDDFGERLDGVEVIRNDSLEFRDIDEGPRSGLSIQEANVLDIRVRYCQSLVFPIIDRLLVSILRRIDPSLENQFCYAVRRVPISSRGVVHMQSDARRDGIE